MYFKAILITALLSWTAGPVFAAGQTKETWQASWSGGKCTLILNYDTERLQGSVKKQKPCGKLLRKAKSFVYTDETRDHMILFARKNARGDILGSFDRTGKNNMAGTAGDGQAVSLFLSASSNVSVSGGLTGSSGGASQVSNNENCVRYAHRPKCALSQDMKNPSIPTFQTLRMKAIARQPIFPFSGGKGFAKDEKLAKGSCAEVKKCERAFNSSEDWCEILLSDGFFTGWVKRQDEDWVYLRQGC